MIRPGRRLALVGVAGLALLVIAAAFWLKPESVLQMTVYLALFLLVLVGFLAGTVGGIVLAIRHKSPLWLILSISSVLAFPPIAVVLAMSGMNC